MASAEDSRGRTITTALRPDRIVSLVPSVTESVAQLAGVKRLVGITKFCTEPEADAPAIRKIGGTKDPDIAAIVALAPDLVLANREENREEDIAALEAAGLQVYVGYPRTARDALEDLKTIARLLHFAMVRPIVALVTEEIERQETLNADRPRVRVFCPIWYRPFMAAAGDTYAGDLIRLAGGENVFESHVRGNRYPQVELSEVARADPEVILLPSEPYRFGRRHRREVQALRSNHGRPQAACLPARWAPADLVRRPRPGGPGEVGGVVRPGAARLEGAGAAGEEVEDASGRQGRGGRQGGVKEGGHGHGAHGRREKGGGGRQAAVDRRAAGGGQEEGGDAVGQGPQGGEQAAGAQPQDRRRDAAGAADHGAAAGGRRGGVAGSGGAAPSAGASRRRPRASRAPSGSATW